MDGWIFYRWKCYHLAFHAEKNTTISFVVFKRMENIAIRRYPTTPGGRTLFKDKVEISFEEFKAALNKNFANEFPELALMLDLSAAPSIPQLRQQCRSCGKTFESKQPATYCSGKCRTKASRNRSKETPDVTQE